MRVLCRHGHFAFYPETTAEVWRFARIVGEALAQDQDYFTFASLVGLPRFSIILKPYGLLPATATYEGRHAFEVMRENGFAYSLALKTLVPILAVTSIVSLPTTLNTWRSPTLLLQPGSILTNGQRIHGYEGNLDLDLQRLYIYSLELDL